MKHLVLASLLVAAACATSPYEQPYSIIAVDPARAADPHVIAVFINRVDERNSLFPDRTVVPPGHHRVTVDVPPRKGFHLPTQSTFELQTEPCTRYYISARLDTLVTQEWKPVVRSVEPIGECLSKFHLASGVR